MGKGKLNRNVFNMSSDNLLTADMGYLIPVGLEECLPGDTWRGSTSALIRAQPMVAPILSPVHITFHHWFVPYRLLWTEFEDFITGGEVGISTPEYPYIPASTTDNSDIGTIFDYMDAPLDSSVSSGGSVTGTFSHGPHSALPYRAYNLIYNNFYRDQDLHAELPIGYESGPDNTTLTQLQRVAWIKDRYTIARPWQQKGPEVSVPVFSSNAQRFSRVFVQWDWRHIYPVWINGGCQETQASDRVMYRVRTSSRDLAEYVRTHGSSTSLASAILTSFRAVSGSSFTDDLLNQLAPSVHFWLPIKVTVESVEYELELYMVVSEFEGNLLSAPDFENGYTNVAPATSTGPICYADCSTVNYDGQSVVPDELGYYYFNPGAWTSGPRDYTTKYWSDTIGITVPITRSEQGSFNLLDLRKAEAMQRIYEARAKYGSRYIDFLQYYGISPSDKRLQLPEFIGGSKTQLQISEVLQTSPGTDSYVGDMYGHGISATRGRRWKWFCEEHGLIMTLMFIRPKTLYVGSTNPHFDWDRTREQFYQRELSTIGAEAVLKRELYYNKNATVDGMNPFGYVGRYDTYRHSQSRVHGYFRTTMSQWHLGRIFETQPELNGNFITCNPAKRPFADVSSENFTFWILLRHNFKAMRCMAKRARSSL